VSQKLHGRLGADCRCGTVQPYDSGELTLGSLEVSTYRPRKARSAATRPDVRARASGPRRIAAPGLAAIVSLALHALLVTSMVWGGRARAPRTPELRPLGNAATESPEEAAMQWVVLTDAPSADASSAATAAIPPSPLFTAIAVTDPSNEVPPDLADSATADSDAAAAAQLYGRYMGQIDARIERAWLRPRTPIGADEFSCRARIHQDGNGNVVEVTLERCNGDSRWQLSLVHAIETASPLPAPPDPRVFARVIRLNFQSDAYKPGAQPEQYEPELMAARAAGSSAHDTQRALREFRDALDNPRSKDGVIDLRIQGDATQNRTLQPEQTPETRDLYQTAAPPEPPSIPNNSAPESVSNN